MQFNILGPLEVVAQGRVVPLGGVKPRTMLGVLLLSANRVVPSSKLLEALWAHGAPPTARKMLQNAASALRDVLACEDVDAERPALLTHAPGYLLYVKPDTIDLNLFNLHTERGRAHAASADWESARQELRSALDLWRGTVLADLPEAHSVWPEAATIQNTHLVVVEELLDAELACGRHREVVAELHSMVQREPHRERLVGQLMLALYRCGRQLDALDVYRHARGSLLETYGLEPSRDLRELEHSILNHDMRLEWRGGAVPPAGDSAVTVTPRDAVRAVSAGPATTPQAPPGVRVSPESGPLNGHAVPRADKPRFSTMAVVSELDSRPGTDVAQAAAAVTHAFAIVDYVVGRHSGVVVSRVGSVSWIAFDDPDHAADQAVDAGLAIRDALTTTWRTQDAADRGLPRVTVKIAVVSSDGSHGDQPRDGTLHSIDSAIVGRCLQLASAAATGRFWVGDETERATEPRVRYERVSVGAWEAVETSRSHPGGTGLRSHPRR